ncbi:MAG: Gfo/Idh/MocA family oxidoreductase [Armatimonadetes bacterium]|nr:Gfo/Idh/MocA family oxidoreductase [Armatimonadota bacterium]
MPDKGPKPLRIGVVGAGANTRLRHLPGLQSLDDVQVVSVCNRSRESSRRVAQEFGIPKIYDHWTELVVAPDTNAVVIGTWPNMHAPLTLAALAADKHVLCEARMAMNAGEARAMRDAARSRPHLTAQVVPAPMTLHADPMVQRLLAEGYLGEVLAVEVRDGGTFLDTEAPLHWRQDADLSGFNVMTLGIWYETLMRWVGEAESVTASGRTFVKMRKDAAGVMRAVRVPEHIDVVAGMACGAQAHLQISRVTGFGGPPEALLFGSEGTLRFSEGKLFGARRGDAELREIPIPSEETGWRVEEEFVNAIRGHEPVRRTTFEDGVKYMEFTEAVARSMASGQAVPLPLF